MKLSTLLSIGSFRSLILLQIFAIWGFYEFFTSGNNGLLKIFLCGMAIHIPLLIYKLKQQNLAKKA